MSRSLTSLLVLAVLVVGCSATPAATPSEPVGPAPTTTTTTSLGPPPSPTTPTTPTTPATPTDLPAVPDQIDAAYVEGVLTELETVLAEVMTVYSRQEGFDDPDASARLAAIMTPDGAQSHLGLTDVLVQQSGWEVFADPVGVPEISVEEVARADQHCVIARVARDAEPVYSQYSRTDVPRVWLVLRRVEDDPLGAAEAAEHNPTPWRIQFYGTKQGQDGPPTQECG